MFRSNFTACYPPIKDLKIRERTIQVKISPGDILRGHHHRHMPSCPLCITRLWILLQSKKYSVFFYGDKSICFDVFRCNFTACYPSDLRIHKNAVHEGILSPQIYIIVHRIKVVIIIEILFLYIIQDVPKKCALKEF